MKAKRTLGLLVCILVLVGAAYPQDATGQISGGLTVIGTARRVSTIADLVTANDAAACNHIILDGRVVLPSSFVLSKYLTVDGGGLIVLNGNVFTAPSPDYIGAPPGKQVFDITAGGSVSFKRGGDIYADRFQTNASAGTTDMAPAVQAAFDSLPSGHVLLFPTPYYFGRQVLSTKSEVGLLGSGKEATKIIYAKSDGTAALKFSTKENNNIARVTLRDFRVYGFDGSNNETDGVGIEIVDGVYFVVEDIYIEGFRNAGGTGKGLAIYGHYNNRFKRLHIQWCDQAIYLGENPNAHAKGIDIDLFDFEDITMSPTPDTEQGTCVYIDSNYVNNMTWHGSNEWSMCKYGFYWSKALFTSASQILIEGGRLEYQTPQKDARFIYFNPSAHNIYNLTVRDIRSPYPIELSQNVNFITLDNIFLADGYATAASLITGATVGPMTVRNSRILHGTSIAGRTVWKKAANGSVLSDGYFQRSTDANAFQWRQNTNPSELFIDNIDLHRGYSYRPDFVTYKVHRLRITSNGGGTALLVIQNPTSILPRSEGLIIIENASGGPINTLTFDSKYYMAAGEDAAPLANGEFLSVGVYVISSDQIVEQYRTRSSHP
jgi:hypothetical protein